MKIELTPQEVELLENEGIQFLQSGDYTEDEALELLERVREAEVAYSQGTDEKTGGHDYAPLINLRRCA